MSDNLKKAEPPKPVTGDGIRSLETSGVFRTLNFELYAKPNKFVMAFGLVAITGFHFLCVILSFIAISFFRLSWLSCMDEESASRSGTLHCHG